jgi:hypothetical protein
MKRSIALLLAIVACGALFGRGLTGLAAAEKKPFKEVDLAAFLAETQKAMTQGRGFNVVWIVPGEFWDVSLAKDKNLTEAARRPVLDALGKYLIVAVIRADISPLGAFRFFDEKAVSTRCRSL